MFVLMFNINEYNKVYSSTAKQYNQNFNYIFSLLITHKAKTYDILNIHNSSKNYYICQIVFILTF